MITYILSVLVIILLLKLKRISEQHENLKNIPAPSRLPLIGNMHLMRDYEHNPWDGFNQIRKQYGDIVSLQMGVHHMILLSKLDYMNEVLLDKGKIFADRPNFSRYDIIFGGDKENSLALCKWGDVHLVRRKFCKRGVVPSKFSERHQLLESIIYMHTNNLMSRLNDRSALQLEDIELNKTDLLFLTGDIFMKFLCNEKFSHDDKAYQKFNWGCDYIFNDINNCQVVDFLPYLAHIGVQRSYLRELTDVTNYCRYFIDDNIYDPRVKHHEQRLAENKEPAQLDDDYLDKIIVEQLTRQTIMTAADYKVGFSDLLAGHSAVANILMKLLGHLALEPEAQDLLHEEAVSKRKSELGRTSLPVAEAALLEALRFASSPIVPHVAREDTSIGDYFVPKGSNILFNHYHINMSAEYWDEPSKFNIKRFLSEEIDPITGLKSYKLEQPKFFNPFSIGLRQCLGFRMVENISTIAASMICGRYRFKANDEDLVRDLLKPRGSVALSPFKQCYILRLTPRDCE